MKNKLKNWKGQFLYDQKLYDKIEDIPFKSEEKFKIKLLAKRREK